MPEGVKIAVARHIARMLVRTLLLSLAMATWLATPGAWAAGASYHPEIASVTSPSDWSQYQHDVSRSGATEVKGPLWPEIVPGWPVTCGGCLFGPATARLEGSGGSTGQAIFAGGWLWTLHGFDDDGQYLPGWPVTVYDASSDPIGVSWLRYPAAGASGEIFTAREGNSSSYSAKQGRAYGLQAAGQPLAGEWPAVMATHRVSAFPTLGREPRSAFAEQVGPTLYVASDYAPDPDTVPEGGFLHALRPDGRYRFGWPVQIGDTWLFSGPAVADDGSVYITSNFYNEGDPYSALQAFSPTGKPKWNRLHYRFPEGYDAWTAGPSVAGDGTVYAAATFSPDPDLTADRSLLYAFAPAGQVKPGWPVEIEGRVVGTPAVAGDGTIYVSVQKTGSPNRQYVYAFEAAGSAVPGWPVSFTGGSSDPYTLPGSIRSIAVDGDGNVFFGHMDRFFGYNREAQPLAGWPVSVPGGGSWDIWGPAIAADGTIYFVIASQAGHTGTEKIYALRVGSPAPHGSASKRRAGAGAATGPRTGRRSSRPRRVARRVKRGAHRGSTGATLRMPSYPNRVRQSKKGGRAVSLSRARAAFARLVAPLADALAGLAAEDVPAMDSSDWNQYAHDASRANASDASGPLWPRLVKGWPVTCDCWAQPVVASVRLAGRSKRVTGIFAAGTYNSTIYGFAKDGQPLPGWPAVLGPDCSGCLMGIPAVAGDRGETRVFSNRMGDYQNSGAMQAATGDGKPAPWPWPWVTPGLLMWTMPTVAPRASKPGRETVYFVYGGHLQAMGADGSRRPGWPALVGNPWWWSGPAVAPDGSVYIGASGCDDGEYADCYWKLEGFTPAGERKPGWPVVLAGYYEATLAYTGPAVGRDGTVYIGMQRGYQAPSTTRYYAFGPNGKIKEGWPVKIEGSVSLNPAVAADGTSYVSVYDYDRTQGEYTYYSSVYAFDSEGNTKPGWPISFPGESYRDPVSGIVLDADGNVFFAHHDTLYGLTPQGTPLPGWPLKIEGSDLVDALPSLGRDGTIYAMDYSVWGIVAVEQGPTPSDPQSRKRRLAHGTKIRLPRRAARSPKRGGRSPASLRRGGRWRGSERCAPRQPLPLLEGGASPRLCGDPGDPGDPGDSPLRLPRP